MYMSTNDLLVNIEGGIKTSNNETAFPITMVQQVYNAVSEKQWIILGGDIITSNFDYTYDSWYYNPSDNVTLLDNVLQSIHKSEQFISKYIGQHGAHYLVVFTISDSYVDGRIKT